MTRSCKFCGARLFPGELSTLCCKNGEVQVPLSVFDPRRDERLEWFWEIAHNNEKVYQMLRPINNMIACAAINVNLKQFVPQQGPVPLVLQGAYKMGIVNLTSESENANPCFAQLYLADDFKLNHALCENVKNLSVDDDTGNLIAIVIKRLISQLKEFNPIVQAYMTMLEVYVEELARTKKEGLGEIPQILMNVKQKRDVPEELTRDVHKGRLNPPVFENQVAAIYICRDGNMPTNEELDEGIRIYSRGNRGVIPHHSYNIDAFSYPLLFPGAEQPFPKNRLPKKIVRRGETRKACNDAEEGDAASSDCGVEQRTGGQSPLCLDKTEPAFDPNSKANTEKRINRRFVSRREHSLYITARRGDITKHRLLGTGKLFAQYVLHLFTRIEADRISAIVRSRTEIRSTTASALYKYIDQKLQEKGIRLGKLVTMPSYYVGSRSWCRKQYSVGMAVAQRLGKPDLFITFTGNSEWREIKENLPTKLDTWMTEPLLCVRVFYLKLKQFLNELVVEQIFGPVEAYQLSVEFQKRGMPHAHVLVTLKNKFVTVEDVDSCISAVIPDQPKSGDDEYEKKCRVFDCVKRFMIHGPCANRDDLECRKKNPNLCEKRFPKPYRDYTEITEDGYPLYKRPNDDRFVTIGRRKTTIATNRDVVPYNQYLIARFGCHINVEVCTHIRSYKYIFKYIHKGVDQILLEVLSDEQEMKKRSRVEADGKTVVDLNLCHEFIRARFVSHIEGAFRICGFDLQKCSHTVIFLRPHLEDENVVYFKEGQDLKQTTKVSPLLAYFQLCKDDECARSLTWVEVAERYVFHKGVYRANKHFCRRIARIDAVNPRFTELYALRKLLLYSRGATSFASLKEVHGHVYQTFVEAAKAAGYMTDSDEWDLCMKSAVELEMPYIVRKLFAQILMHCHPANPIRLWEAYKKEMRCGDRGTDTTEQEKDFATIEYLRQILLANGTDLDACGLGEVQLPYVDESAPANVEHSAHPENKPIGEVLKNLRSDLNEDQLRIAHDIIASVERGRSKQARVFFLYGRAGCGKTFLFNYLIAVLEASRKKVVAVASTGIAATLLTGGRTAHSTFRLPTRGSSVGKTTNVDASSALADRFRSCDIIIWDEISMQSKGAVESVEKMLQDVAPVEFRQVPFGGVLVLFGGDWTQFLPVVPNGTKDEILNETLKYSYIWKYVTVLKLEKNMRMVKGSEKYCEWLRLIGEGALQIGKYVAVPNSMVLPNERDVINWVYTPEVLSSADHLRDVALLSIRNRDVLNINEIVLEKLDGEVIIARGIDEAVREDDGIDGLPCENEEDLHKEIPQGMPPYLLRLKLGCILMLLRNIDVANQLCNGTRLQLLSVIYDNGNIPVLLKCRNLINGEVCLVPRIPMDYEDAEGLAFKRFQFPVRLSFCITINKSQGQTFEKVGIIFRSLPFAHGSTYVAFSRVRRQENIKITINDNKRERGEGYLMIKNIVYKEIVR
ncbi:hypothetical protein OESDEN_04632 [Oesophagostomum dentatum]|uniref:ATP-dependent DNA helicase n=1 Tax=Oesophagostomum dentatum TaxID=61180 RepID=A0A0B1TCY0_OESDE|nr:hypothetical protein OESDEN_04632 [Oesophagostomum dentatum]